MESFSWLSGNPRCKEVGACVALSGAAPVDQVSLSACVAVLAGDMHGLRCFTGSSLVNFM